MRGEKKNLQYARREYWDKRFEEEKNYEWITGFDSFKDILLKRLNKTYKILHIGCGSSDLSMQLRALGFMDITNVDYSEVLIASRKAAYPEQEWICDDIRTLSRVPKGVFDVVIEKATIEAMLVAEKSPWSPSTEALSTLDCVWTAVSSCLKERGIFLSLSFTQPHFRIPALLRFPYWDVMVDEFGAGFHFFVYTCEKGRQPCPDVVRKYARMTPDWLLGSALLTHTAND